MKNVRRFCTLLCGSRKEYITEEGNRKTEDISAGDSKCVRRLWEDVLNNNDGNVASWTYWKELGAEKATMGNNSVTEAAEILGDKVQMFRFSRYVCWTTVLIAICRNLALLTQSSLYTFIADNFIMNYFRSFVGVGNSDRVRIRASSVVASSAREFPLTHRYEPTLERKWFDFAFFFFFFVFFFLVFELNQIK